MFGVLSAALAQFHGDELVAFEDLLADELRLIFRRCDLGAQTGGLALVGHDDTGHGVHILFEGDITPDGSPKAHAGHGNHHAAVGGFEYGELAVVESALKVLQQLEDILAFKLVAVGVEHVALDEGAVILTLRRERRKDRLLLLVQLVGVLARLERKCGHGQQRRYDDHHHRRVHYNICVAVLVAEQPLFLLVLQFDERRSGGHADRAFFGCGVSFVNVAANGAFEFFRCHILPYFASLTRFFLREMFASTT